MTISVCIPTCNRPKLLSEAVMSCLNQSLLPDEILVGDDSKDNLSQEIILKLQKVARGKTHIRYHKNPVSLGQAENVNSLIDKVSGDKVVLLHDDDLLLPEAFSLMASAFEKHPEADAVFGKQFIIDNEGNINLEKSQETNDYFFRTSYFAKHPLSSLEAGVVQQFPNDCYMLDSNAAKRVRYRRKEQIGNAGDFDFGLRLALNGAQFIFINKYLAKYRITNSSVARDGTDSGFRAFKILSESAVPKDNTYVDLILRRKAPVAISEAIAYGRKKDARRIYFSKWHRNKIFTAGGLKRFVMLLKPSI